MIPINIDNVQFEVWGDRTLWSPPSANGEFVEAPTEYAKLARALVCCDYEDVGWHTHVADCELLFHAEPGSLVHFPAKAGLPPYRATRVLTGVLQGRKVITILDWDDPLRHVLTTVEADREFGLAAGSAWKSARRGTRIYGERRGGIYLLRRVDAVREWG